jgi:hypothetical protein
MLKFLAKQATAAQAQMLKAGQWLLSSSLLPVRGEIFLV